MLCCRLNRSTRKFLVILQGAVLVLLFGWHMELGPIHSTPSDSKVHVLLLTSWRSGSTFMGEIFSRNPSVFYLMEPAWHVWRSMEKASTQQLQAAVRDLLQSTFKCNLSVMETYLPKHPKVSSLFRWADSRALCSPPACPLMPHNRSRNVALCKKLCKTQDLQHGQEACSAHRHVVIKVVRVFELESLNPLLLDPSLDLRIIHLVRDPRAVFLSREGVWKALRKDNAIMLKHRNVSAAEVHNQVMKEVCHSHVHINERAVLNPPHFLKGCYKRVRYEDIIHNPLEEINAIHEFVGLELTTELEEWIYRVTHGKNRGRGGFRVTSRNATDVSQAWRKAMSHDKVKQIQEVCEEAMTLLGYRTVNSEEEQKNLGIELVV
ncbi:carbohydrate sulfotransferase 6-like [Cheilinus undulatus]|uniref:carbohydrate sulfotransferase 6-like n=1 Tax=Cheilinus undulatus TaxID=241271 RepID=UPI001BD49E9E|nr:carbohydrate sulfotransferase 6-like [Cheilinus undulatus]